MTMTLDHREEPFQMEAEHQLFYATKKTIQDLKKVAEQTGVEIRKPIMLGKDKIWRYKDAPALRFLEEHI